MKITDKDKEYPNEAVAVFDQLKRIADLLEKFLELALKQDARG